MAQPELATTIREWMEEFAEAVSEGRVSEISAGGGPDVDFAYLHFRTADGEHCALVFRAAPVDSQSRIRVVEVSAGPDEIRDLLDSVTHGDAEMRH